MVMMNYLFGLVSAFIIFGVLVLSSTHIPYYGVISLMGVSFFCCVYMVILGRTFAALMMYIVYLGGLVVVFGYCVSVEKSGEGDYKVGGVKYLIMLFVVLLIFLWLAGVGGVLSCYSYADLVCVEVNGGGVFYSEGGLGLVVCSWGLLVVLFSILIILSWSRLGGLRPF